MTHTLLMSDSLPRSEGARSLQRFVRQGLLPFLLLFAFSFWLSASRADLGIQRLLFQGSDGWSLGYQPIFKLANNFGPIPAFACAGLCVVTLIAGIGHPRIARYRKVCLFLLLTFALGSGLIGNLLLKNLLNRPRPSEIFEFGGACPYLAFPTFGSSGGGRSFCCGHATVGYFFLAVALALPRRRPALRLGVGAAALLFGSFIGFARMAQGGHFASDVVRAAAVMWLVSVGLFYLFDLPGARTFAFSGSPLRRSRLRLLAAPAASIVFLGAGLAWPLDRRLDFEVASTAYDFEAEGDVEIRLGDDFQLTSVTEGYGWPRSSFRIYTRQKPDGLLVGTLRKGVFTEAHHRFILTIPRNQPLRLRCGPKIGHLILPDRGGSADDPWIEYSVANPGTRIIDRSSRDVLHRNGESKDILGATGPADG